MKRVVLMRGTAANPWELRPWERLHAEGAYDVRLILAPDNSYDVSSVRLPATRVRTTGALMPPGPPGRLLLKGIGQRHLGLATALRGADLVHAAELGYWFTRQAALLKAQLGYRLVVTVWETLPFIDAYRNIRTRAYRRDVLREADLFLPATQRAADGLILEGVSAARIRVCPPGIDVERFESYSEAPAAGETHEILSIGRLVWEKGHQDLLRAVAHLAAAGRRDLRVVIVGQGPEERRLRGVAADLGIADRVQFRGFVPHAEVPALLARASCLVLASIPVPYWEEQFGMVLAEALAARLPIVAAASGAIPEVVGGHGVLFPPGDWAGLADSLAESCLSQPPGTRAAAVPELVERYSSAAAARRLTEAYTHVLSP